MCACHGFALGDVGHGREGMQPWGLPLPGVRLQPHNAPVIAAGGIQP